MNTQSNETKQRPVENFRDGAIQVAIWPRQSQNGIYYEIDRTRSYKDKNGDWQATRLISERDMLKARRLEDQAYETIQRLKEQNRTLQSTERPQSEATQQPDQLSSDARLVEQERQAVMSNVSEQVHSPAHEPSREP